VKPKRCDVVYCEREGTERLSQLPGALLCKVHENWLFGLYSNWEEGEPDPDKHPDIRDIRRKVKQRKG
jgi:hypothetical protein